MLKLQGRSQMWLRLHRFILCTRLSGSTAHERVVLPMSQLDLPSLTPLWLAGCGRLKLGVQQWATSVDYWKLLIIDPTFCGSADSPLGSSWPKTLPLLQVAGQNEGKICNYHNFHKILSSSSIKNVPAFTCWRKMWSAVQHTAHPWLVRLKCDLQAAARFVHVYFAVIDLNRALNLLIAD